MNKYKELYESILTRKDDAVKYLNMYNAMYDYSYDDSSSLYLRQLSEKDKDYVGKSLITSVVITIATCLDKSKDCLSLFKVISYLNEESKGGILNPDAQKLKDDIEALILDASDIIVWRDMYYAHKDKAIIDCTQAKRRETLLNAELNTYQLGDLLNCINDVLIEYKNYFREIT